MRYRSKIKYTWSNNIAYSVGLMASDGCLQSDGRHLDLTSAETEQLRNFSVAINKTLNISSKGNSAFRVQFSDVSYYDFLVKTGLTPRKSKTIGVLNIPKKYHAAFLRGLYDGDGTSYAYYDPRWNNSYLYYISFSSASKYFLEYVAKKNQELIGLRGKSIRKGKNSFILGYGKRDSYKIYRSIYKDTEGLYLSRKRKKLEGFILKDNNGKILGDARVL